MQRHENFPEFQSLAAMTPSRFTQAIRKQHCIRNADNRIRPLRLALAGKGIFVLGILFGCACALAAPVSSPDEATPAVTMNVMSAAITSAPDADGAPRAASGATPLEPVAAVSGASFSIFQKRPLRIGIITLWETPETTLALENTLKTIQRIFAPYPVEVDPRILSKDLEARIASGSIDVFIASSGFCLRMNRYGVVPLATLITTRQPDPNNGIGTTYLVRSDDDRFHKIDDLKGTRLSASYDTAFMSYRTGLGEIAVRGYDPEHFFSDIHFSGDSDNLPIAERLDKGLADVAMVRACWLEGQPESVRRRYRVIEPQPTDVLHCEHTSRTYPNVMVSILQGSPPGTAHLIARTLLSIPEIAPGHHWGVATDVRAVNRLYRELKIENYAYLRETSLERWVAEHASWIAVAALLVLGLILHGWRTEYLVRVRTLALRESLETLRRATARNQALSERMAKFEKAAVLGQLSNLITHELAQPLASIRFYCESFKDLLAGGGSDLSALERCRAGIEKGLRRTTAIVARVRGYSKNETKRTDAVAVLPIIERVLAGLSDALKSRVKIDVRAEGLKDEAVLGDALELELLFGNLIRNACEAALAHEEKSGAPAPESERGAPVRIRRLLPGAPAAAEPCPEAVASDAARPDRLVLLIENEGGPVSDDMLTGMKTPLISSKPGGLGLGVPIANAIAEASGGHLEFARRTGGGLCACLVLRRCSTQSSENSHHDD